jgi:hypothetical protein
MWDKCFKTHSNIQMVIAGDQGNCQTYRQISTGVNGNRVYEILQDYQTFNRYSTFRIYRFLPVQNKLQVFTYDPIKNVLVDSTELAPDKKCHNFELSWSFNGPDKNGYKPPNSKTANQEVVVFNLLGKKIRTTKTRIKLVCSGYLISRVGTKNEVLILGQR